MKTALTVVALLISLATTGCLGTATQEDIDTLAAEESGQVGETEMELMNTGGLGFTCSGTSCSCEPDGEDVVTSCEGFPEACADMQRRVTCCGWRASRRGWEFLCSDGYTELASYCFCGSGTGTW